MNTISSLVDKTTRKRSTCRDIAPVAPPLPPPPPPTAEQRRPRERIARRLHELERELRQSNLAKAVLLAQRAAAGGGDPELTAHFAELGRRFGHALDQAPPKPRLRLVEGGVA